MTMATLADLERRYFATGPGAAPIESDNSRVEVLVDGEAYFGAINTAVGATGSGDFIYIAGWWFDDKVKLSLAATKSVGEVLVEKQVAGVDVRVIIWAHPNLAVDSAWSLEFTGFKDVVESNIYAARGLRALKPGSAADPPLEDRVLLDWAGDSTGSLHQKSVVVKAGTELSAFLGGIDFAPSRLDRPRHDLYMCKDGSSSSAGTRKCGWHDAGVKLTGQAALAVLDNFRFRWNECLKLPPRVYKIGWNPAQVYNPKATSLAVAPVSAVGLPLPPRQSIQVLRSFSKWKTTKLTGRTTTWSTAPHNGGLEEVRKTFLKAIAAAAPAPGRPSYIYVEDQSMDSKILFAEIVGACKRGVRVILLVPGLADPTNSSGGRVNTDVSDDLQDEVIDKLTVGEQANLAVWRLDRVILHSKLILIDDEFLSIGSANFMDRSMIGTDVELTAAVVDSGTLVRDERVKLWAEHLNVDATDPIIGAELSDLTKALGFWRSGWGSGVTFPHPTSSLVGVWPP
jgi:phosphatidylserine/phosphatidylglycerophosphate/cardiolipin synthase-like enzyme